jgi:ubiquinone biosynthesis accessory factor UbiJ
MSLFTQPLIQKLAPSIETAINKALAMDPAATKKLKPLNGCILEINIESLKQSLFIGAKDGRVLLLSADKAPTVMLTGSVSALIKLALLKDKTTLLKQRQISFSGDAVRAQQIQTFASSLQIDWEGLLADTIGDTPARFLSSSTKQSFMFMQTLSKNFIRDVEDYIKYELRLLPTKARAAKQFEAIDQLRLASDRLEARVKIVTKKFKRG